MLVKRILIILISLTLSSACAASGGAHGSYKKEFYDLFDTYTVIQGYARSGREFQAYSDLIYREMLRLHRLFDIYNSYEGVNNMKTINDCAGVSAVKVDPSIIELLTGAKLAYEESGGSVNVAMGSVFRIWHDYREKGIADPGGARLPPIEELKEAVRYTDINDMIIDEEASTVFLENSGMKLDVGALAKGFAVEKAVAVAKQAGFKSGFISAGGNVSVLGKPADGRDSWSIGIQTPATMPDGSQPLYDTVYVTDRAVVSSGGYQRYYVAGGKAYHHIIDPQTLMPASRFSAVTVIHPDSGVADMLSTSIFIMPYEQGLQLILKYNADAIWIYHDNTSRSTQGYKAVSRMFQENIQ